MYDDILENPKILLLDDKTHRTWVNVLAVARRYGGALPPMRELAVLLRLSEKETTRRVKTLIQSGLIEKAVANEETLTPHNWDELQFHSDVSTDRVRAFRERNRERNETHDETFHDDFSETHETVSRNGVPYVFCNSVVSSQVVESQQEEVVPLPVHARGRQ